MLRNLLLGLFAILFLGALLLFAIHPGMVGPLIVSAVLLLGTALERVGYGRAGAPPPPGRGWERTSERFVDPGSGRLVAVWFDPASGERRYVDEERPPRD